MTKTKNARDLMLISLREQGWTYDAIADALFRAGHTEKVVSTVRILTLMRRVAPHLCGNIKRKRGLSKLIHKGDDETKEIF